jgi:hypothetical protein
MKKRMIWSFAVACALVLAGWLVVLHHGVGTCGPASDTPVWCILFTLGPIWLWMLPFPALEQLSESCKIGFCVVMYGIPAVTWFLILFGGWSVGALIRRQFRRP